MMNVQATGLTGSGSNLVSRTAYTTIDKTPPTTQSAPTPQIEVNGKSLARLEKQGYNLSIAEEQVVRAIERAVKALEGPSTTFEMKMHEQTKAIVVKVFNKETGELIREIPPEKTLDLVAKMMEFAGILVDEKV